MEFANRYYCAKCYSVYDELSHKPRIIQKCLHSFCEQCLTKMIENSKLICPEDQVVVERVRSAEDFPLNYELLRFIRQNKGSKAQAIQIDLRESINSSNDSQNQLGTSNFKLFNNEDRHLNTKDICPIHRYKFEFYCQDHNQPLCLACIQTKEHSNHQIIDNNELNKKISDSKQRIENIHRSLKDQHLFYENEQKAFLNDIHQILQNRQREVTLLIQQKFQVCYLFLKQDLVHKLRNLEDLAVRQVGILVLKIEDYVRETLSFSQKDICFQITEFHRRLDQILMEPQIILTQQEDSIIKQGQQIIQKIQIFLNKEKHQISSTITDNLKVEFLDSNLENYCSVPASLQLSANPTQSVKQKQQAQLLPSTKKLRQSLDSNYLSYSKNSQFHHPQQQNPDSERILKTEGNDDNCLPQFRLDSLSIEQNKTMSHFIQIKVPKKQEHPVQKLTSLSFHESKCQSRNKSIDSRIIERIKQQLMGNKDSDKLDMSNQGTNHESLKLDLDDSDLLQICEWLQHSKSNIEIIKLAKNKISDQGFFYLLKCLQKKPNIHTINLTNNQCTSKALEILNQYVKKGDFKIKNIYLTNCRINPGKYKDQQQLFQKQGINLYL